MNHKPDASLLKREAGQYMTGLLREANITQAEAAAAVGMNERTLRLYLNGQRTTKSTLYLLQFALERLTAD